MITQMRIPVGLSLLTMPTSRLLLQLPAGVYRDSVYQPGLGLTAGTAAFVWRHDRFDPGVPFDVPAGTAASSPYCDWPYLLRVRYRFHDGRGRLASTEGRQGVWFEQVLRVNRPFPAATP